MAAPAKAITAAAQKIDTGSQTVVVSVPDDPLYPLAQEIAASEKLDLLEDLSGAFRPGATHVIWVISPQRLSDQAVMKAGKLHLQAGLQSALGILTAESLDEARLLWERKTALSARHAYAVNAVYPTAGVLEGRILEMNEITRSMPLTKDSLRQALQAADYLTFTGHGSGRSWRLAEDLPFLSADIPALPPAALSAASCQTWRPWVESSIALAFVRQGAAAYAGFAFSPLEGYLLGEFDGLPFRFTSPDFTIGQVMQVQNRGALRSFAALPFYVLLGDPRSALNPAPLFHPQVDERSGGERRLRFSNLPRGVIPVRVRGGADYPFLEFDGTAISDNDLFFNARAQMLPSGNDRLILVNHAGGDLTLVLRQKPPLLWQISDPILDSLDYTLIFLNHRADVLINLGAGGIACFGAVLSAWRRKVLWRWVPASLTIGLVGMICHAAYALARHNLVTVNAKPDLYYPLAPLATFLLAGNGSLFALSARAQWQRSMGWLVALFPFLAPFGLSAGILVVINSMAQVQIGGSLYNAQMLAAPLLSTAIAAVGFYSLLAVIRTFISWRKEQ